ncbi:MAG: hypothetical protein R6V60_09070, partial [Desulfobacterales bacterium]
PFYDTICHADTLLSFVVPIVPTRGATFANGLPLAWSRRKLSLAPFMIGANNTAFGIRVKQNLHAI